MKEQSLYLKYRPQKFADLCGQDVINRTLLNSLSANKVSHAYLFCGSRGTGKTSTARLMAKALNCEDLQNGEVCNQCKNCQAIDKGNFLDMIEIDAASNRGIDEIRDLKEKISFAPNVGKCKVYIIDEAHMLTKEAFNALLKTLEEPPKHCFFILATTETHKIPETISSRCQRFDFKRIDQSSLMERLKQIAKAEQIQFEEAALQMIVKHVNGGMRDAISLLEQLANLDCVSVSGFEQIVGSGGDETFEEILHGILSGELNKNLALVNDLSERNTDFSLVFKNFLWFIREKILLAAQENDQKSLSKLHTICLKINEYREMAFNCPIAQLPLEMALVELHQIFGRAIETTKATPENSQVIEEKNQTNSQKPMPPSSDFDTEMWNEIVSNLTDPKSRNVYRQARNIKESNGVLQVFFDSRFNFDTSKNAAAISFLEEQIALKVGKKLKLEAFLQDSNPPVDTQKKSDEALDKVIQVFGS